MLQLITVFLVLVFLTIVLFTLTPALERILIGKSSYAKDNATTKIVDNSR